MNSSPTGSIASSAIRATSGSSSVRSAGGWRSARASASCRRRFSCPRLLRASAPRRRFSPRISARDTRLIAPAPGGSFPAFTDRRSFGVLVEFGIVTEDAELVEGNSPRRGKVGGDGWSRPHCFAQRRERGIMRGEFRRGAREGVGKAFAQLKEREVDGRQRRPDGVMRSLGIVRQRVFEIAQIFRQAL